MFLNLRPLRSNNAVEASATGSRAVAVPSERSVMIGALSAAARCVKSRRWRDGLKKVLQAAAVERFRVGKDPNLVYVTSSQGKSAVNRS